MTFNNDPQLIAALRELQRRGRHSAELLRFLHERGQIPIEMMDHFREAFSLDSYAVSPIGGWAADGSGELDDDAINTFLDAAIAVARLE
jgi:hypothetical protein